MMFSRIRTVWTNSDIGPFLCGSPRIVREGGGGGADVCRRFTVMVWPAWREKIVLYF